MFYWDRSLVAEGVIGPAWMPQTDSYEGLNKLVEDAYNEQCTEEAMTGLRPVIKDALLLELNQEKADILRVIGDMRRAGHPFAKIQELVKELILGFADIRAKQLANNAEIIKSERCIQAQMTACKHTIDAVGQMHCKQVPTYVPGKCRSYMRVEAHGMSVRKEPDHRERYYHPTQFAEIAKIFESGTLPERLMDDRTFLSTRPEGLFGDAAIIVKPDVVWNDGTGRGTTCWREPTVHCWFHAKKIEVDDIYAIAVKTTPEMPLAKAQEQVNAWIAANPKLEGISIDVIDYDMEAAKADSKSYWRGVSVPVDGSAALRK